MSRVSERAPTRPRERGERGEWKERAVGLDLDDPKIWTQYYNKPGDYHALREIKRKLDPDDLFHSKFTLRPAEH